ncbi:MAG: hypothetical protein JRK53_00765 [Deltaproteobacteria bacterium]|nr:hypothetical protein [Deltaproteobacteria bacterium]MBW1816118.1 hypothetical protein [Deltaproteobacteria bacterium]
MNSLAYIHRFRSALPAIREWIETTLAEHEAQAVAVNEFDFPRLQKAFSGDVLKRAKSVVIKGKVPFPPLTRMGLGELATFERMSIAGITYKDTFFVSRPHQTESLYFHEMVHVLQWERLGIDDFLLTYATGLIKFGYRDCPLEQIAYSLEEKFERGTLPDGVVDLIWQKIDAVQMNWLTPSPV